MNKTIGTSVKATSDFGKHLEAKYKPNNTTSTSYQTKNKQYGGTNKPTRYVRVKLGLHSTEATFLLLIKKPHVQFLAFPRIFLLMLLRFIDGTASNSEHDAL